MNKNGIKALVAILSMWVWTFSCLGVLFLFGGFPFFLSVILPIMFVSCYVVYKEAVGDKE